jgi:hypothetical protein
MKKCLLGIEKITSPYDYPVPNSPPRCTLLRAAPGCNALSLSFAKKTDPGRGCAVHVPFAESGVGFFLLATNRWSKNSVLGRPICAPCQGS